MCEKKINFLCFTLFRGGGPDPKCEISHFFFYFSNETFPKILAGEIMTGLDYNFLTNPHLSEWLITIFLGRYEKFLDLLDGLSEEEVKVLVSKRESLYNISAVFHVVNGARELYSSKQDYIQSY